MAPLSQKITNFTDNNCIIAGASYFQYSQVFCSKIDRRAVLEDFWIERAIFIFLT